MDKSTLTLNRSKPQQHFDNRSNKPIKKKPATKSIDSHEKFILDLKRSQIEVTFDMISGSTLIGTIESYDRFSMIVIETSTDTRKVVFKSAIESFGA